MDNAEFDQALIAAAFAQVAVSGWRSLSIVEAARSAGLPLDQARARFPGPAAVLMRFGLLADTAALNEPLGESLPRDRLFDLLMRRFDVLQRHRAGVLALCSALPRDPLLSLALGAATLRSMAWMAEVAGLSSAGLGGMVRAQALVAVWLYSVRAWQQDESADLASTMAALDKALDQAGRLFDRAEVANPTGMGRVDDPLEAMSDVSAEPAPDPSPGPPYPIAPAL